jgi:uncharacterized protein YbcV (DUF1398 family)
MTHAHNITAILKEAKEKQRPYPQTFAALRDAGVSSYRVSWQDAYDSLYSGSFGTYCEPVPTGFVVTSIADTFSLDAAKAAIREHQQKKTNFVTLLSYLARAGVSHYVVDMHARTVTYYNPSETYYFVEHVPVAASHEENKQ